LSIIGIKLFRLLLWGTVVAFMLPLASANASEATVLLDVRFDQTNDGIVDGRDWKKMSDQQKQTYARMSLEAIGGNPDIKVSKGRTRSMLLLEGLDSLYGQR